MSEEETTIKQPSFDQCFNSEYQVVTTQIKAWKSYATRRYEAPPDRSFERRESIIPEAGLPKALENLVQAPSDKPSDKPSDTKKLSIAAVDVTHSIKSLPNGPNRFSELNEQRNSLLIAKAQVELLLQLLRLEKCRKIISRESARVLGLDVTVKHDLLKEIVRKQQDILAFWSDDDCSLKEFNQEVSRNISTIEKLLLPPELTNDLTGRVEAAAQNIEEDRKIPHLKGWRERNYSKTKILNRFLKKFRKKLSTKRQKQFDRLNRRYSNVLLLSDKVRYAQLRKKFQPELTQYGKEIFDEIGEEITKEVLRRENLETIRAQLIGIDLENELISFCEDISLDQLEKAVAENESFIGEIELSIESSITINEDNSLLKHPERYISFEGLGLESGELNLLERKKQLETKIAELTENITTIQESGIESLKTQLKEKLSQMGGDIDFVTIEYQLNRFIGSKLLTDQEKHLLTLFLDVLEEYRSELGDQMEAPAAHAEETTLPEPIEDSPTRGAEKPAVGYEIPGTVSCPEFPPNRGEGADAAPGIYTLPRTKSEGDLSSQEPLNYIYINAKNILEALREALIVGRIYLRTQTSLLPESETEIKTFYEEKIDSITTLLEKINEKRKRARTKQITSEEINTAIAKYKTNIRSIADNIGTKSREVKRGFWRAIKDGLNQFFRGKESSIYGQDVATFFAQKQSQKTKSSPANRWSLFSHKKQLRLFKEYTDKILADLDKMRQTDSDLITSRKEILQQMATAS
ncbi:MAG: hypothetical protein JW855_05870 [Gammaproteobacteria bacterium]|nr:hypothetical protein [Gammaproteobacteria bacterium]